MVLMDSHFNCLPAYPGMNTSNQWLVMGRTCGDHLTLQAAANFLQVRIIVLLNSTLGPSATQIVSAVGEEPLFTVSLGHFAEGAGKHYVLLSDQSRNGT